MTKEEQLAQELQQKFNEMENVKVKIALLGQPGAGKSSLINSLLGRKLFEVGVHTDTTTEKQEARFEEIDIVDLPGYGTKAFPFELWKERFAPEQYDLYLFVFEGKLHDTDAQLFESLKEWKQERNHPYFIVRNKSDQIWDDEKSLSELKDAIRTDVYSKMGDRTADVFFTSCRDKSGLAELKEAIFGANIPEVKKSKLVAAFKAETMEDLNRKKRVCLDKVDSYAYMCALNGINPIPGVDVGIDIGILNKLMDEIRIVFGLDDEEKLEKYKFMLPAAKGLVEKVLQYTTVYGTTNVIKKMALQFIGKKPLKVVPFVGQAISAISGYMMTQYLGKEYIDTCYELTKLVLEDVIKKQNK